MWWQQKYAKQRTFLHFPACKVSCRLAVTYLVVPAFWQNLVPVVALPVALVLQKRIPRGNNKVGMNKSFKFLKGDCVLGNVFAK